MSGVCEGESGGVGEPDAGGGTSGTDTGWDPGTSGVGGDSSSGCTAGDDANPVPLAFLFALLAVLAVVRRRREVH